MDSKNLSIKQIFLLLLVVVVVIYFLATWNNKNSDNNFSDVNFIKQEQSDPQDKLSKPSIDVSVYDYYESYYENQISFEENFIGKQILITGTVKAIRSGVFDTPYVDLMGSPNSSKKRDVTAMLKDSQRGVASKLAINDKVQFVCTGAGKTLGDLYVDDCVVYAIGKT